MFFSLLFRLKTSTKVSIKNACQEVFGEAYRFVPMIFTWLAGKVYRTGILMYGKKVSWKEIIRWIKY